MTSHYFLEHRATIVRGCVQDYHREWTVVRLQKRVCLSTVLFIWKNKHLGAGGLSHTQISTFTEDAGFFGGGASRTGVAVYDVQHRGAVVGCSSSFCSLTVFPCCDSKCWKLSNFHTSFSDLFSPLLAGTAELTNMSAIIPPVQGRKQNMRSLLSLR